MGSTGCLTHTADLLVLLCPSAVPPRLSESTGGKVSVTRTGEPPCCWLGSGRCLEALTQLLSSSETVSNGRRAGVSADVPHTPAPAGD